jgi:hypothetical protein
MFKEEDTPSINRRLQQTSKELKIIAPESAALRMNALYFSNVCEKNLEIINECSDILN